MIEKIIPEYAKVRRETCEQCPEKSERNTCKKCGCYLPAKILLKPTNCPLGKWDK
jgi:hypothetical protein